MVVNLSKQDLIGILRTIVPKQSLWNDEQFVKYRAQIDFFATHDYWAWDIDKLNSLSESELFELYKFLK